VTIAGASALHQALYDAIEAADADAFHALLTRHHAEVMAQFESWLTVPEAIRSDQQAASRYAQSVITIARAFDAAGEPSLLQRLTGPDESNPIVQWNHRLRHAQALSEAGKHAESNAQLEKVLAEMQGATGSAVVNLRPKILGSLAFNALHEKEYAAALRYTEQAYEASRAASDEEGMVTYYENLQSLRLIQVMKADPERGRRLSEVRRLVVRAQVSADAGRYRASMNWLTRALSEIGSEGDDEGARALLPKIHGLMGFAEYRLGKVDKARESTALALKEAEDVGDSEGVRVYAANLEAMKGGPS